ncbi:edb51bc1-333e-4a33-8647-c87830b3d5fd [Thermothielavioides terrestris]|uniref:Edb51bc1-333e-4a33-8647-c87830b3d5fd n=1 Tax=Thermothielavioides terrestris TaxID=2587410 RepID=A0A446BCE9_9PEZI|nr:edb51bc1-333e-4a33-8647-c87830b3d5fd [Thermothielavioides terrestris]
MTPAFDFVIVGGGTAGLVLAARLSEDANVQVLVLEAGDDLSTDARVNVPAMWPQLQGTETDWQLKTEPQGALGNRELVIAQGRLLGGSSALNAMNFVVGAREDLDAWAKLGNPGWDWENFSKYLKRTYTVTAGSETVNDGAIQTHIPDEETKWPKVWRDTLAGLGYSVDNDPVSGDICGAVMYPDAIDPKTKTRSFAGNAYLAPARDRPNLTVWTGATVDRILFDHTAEGIVATGVQYFTRDGKLDTVAARKEVILSAGVFHSPKILEQSGIGDAKLLQSLGIDVVVDNPYVGENLQHHPISLLSFETVDDGKEGFDTLDAIARQDPAAVGAAMEAYTTQQRGPFSKTNCNTMAHLPFPGIDTDAGKRELQELLDQSLPPAAASSSSSSLGGKATPAYTEAAESFVRSVLTSPTAASGYYVAIPVRAHPGPSGRMVPAPADSSERYFTVAVLLTRPLSRGSVHLTAAAADPASPGHSHNDNNRSNNFKLSINPNYLAHPLDLEILARHVRFLAGTLARAEPLASRLRQDAGGKRTPPGWWWAADGTFAGAADAEAAKRFLRETAVASTLYAGTCAMMPRAMGGVDAALRVHGTRNLRVVDASVMPFITRGDTMATVYGIAEKAAAGIREGL